MSREIKFRAWHKWREYMAYHIDSLNYINAILSGISYEDRDETNRNASIDDVVLMQYTGLKDKNGKEIYEGDILRTPPKDEWEKINYSCFEVFFHDGDANTDYNIGYSLNRMHNIGSVCGGYIPSFRPKQVSQMEVIGNIYKNPELIKNHE